MNRDLRAEGTLDSPDQLLHGERGVGLAHSGRAVGQVGPGEVDRRRRLAAGVDRGGLRALRPETAVVGVGRGPGTTDAGPGPAPATQPSEPAQTSATEPPGDTPVTVAVYFAGETSRGTRLFKETHQVAMDDPRLAAAGLAVTGAPSTLM